MFLLRSRSSKMIKMSALNQLNAGLLSKRFVSKKIEPNSSKTITKSSNNRNNKSRNKTPKRSKTETENEISFRRSQTLKALGFNEEFLNNNESFINRAFEEAGELIDYNQKAQTLYAQKTYTTLPELTPSTLLQNQILGQTGKDLKVSLKESEFLEGENKGSNEFDEESGTPTLASSFVKDHTKEDICRIFPVNKRLCPGRNAGTIANEWIVNKFPSLLIRKEMIEIKKLMEESLGKNNIAIQGISGCGKSVVLNYAVMYAAENDWLIINLPKAERVFKKTYRIYKAKDRKDIFYQPDYAKQFFDYMLRTQEKNLRKVKLKGSYKSDYIPTKTEEKTIEDNKNKEKTENEQKSEETEKVTELSTEEYEKRIADFKIASKLATLEAKNKEKSEANEKFLEELEERMTLDGETGFSNVDSETGKKKEMTLWDMVEHSQSRNICPNPASLLYNFFEEVNNCTEVPVLIAMDNLNKFRTIPPYRDFDTKKIYAKRLSFVDAVLQYTKTEPLKNGLAILANSSKSRPLDLCGKTFQIRDMYNEEEMKAMLNHYRFLGVYLENKKESSSRVKLLSGNSPKLLRGVVTLF